MLVVAQPPARLPMVLGTTWRTCPFNIALLAAPTFIGTVWAIKTLAPTRLRTSGAACGLQAGPLATTAYCLHCPEMEVLFWAIWYVAGMVIPAVFGALQGRRLLRW